MYNELKKEDFKETVQELVHIVKIASAVTTVDIPGSGHLMIEALIDQLQELLPQKCEHTQATCVPVGQGSVKCACQGSVGMTFGDALVALKNGERVARKGWNGKNQHVELACCITYVNSEQLIVNVDHKNIGNKALAFVGTSGVQMGWLASQADMLAEDWYIVE